MNPISKYSRLLIQSLLLLSLAACTTLDYRTIQSNFERAAQADNNVAVSAFTESSVFTDPGYNLVLEELTDDYIGKLDKSLQPNAWLLRGVSEWRSGRLLAAQSSAKSGLEAGAVDGSRDKILLTLLPALAIDSEIEKEWKNAGESLDLAEYEPLEKMYQTAFQGIDSAAEQFNAGTPSSAKYYLSYQRWRLLTNWQTIIFNLTGGDALQDAQADKAAELIQVDSLAEDMKNAREAVPQSHPLRQLMELK